MAPSTAYFGTKWPPKPLRWYSSHGRARSLHVIPAGLQETERTDEHASFAAYEAIAAALQIYIDGARHGDAERIRSAFLPDASVRGSYGGQPTDWSLEQFCAAIAKGGAAPGLQARIAGIELSGSAAMARLEAENWRGTRYTDFFVLLKRDGAWRIASKVFFAHARA